MPFLIPQWLTGVPGCPSWYHSDSQGCQDDTTVTHRGDRMPFLIPQWLTGGLKPKFTWWKSSILTTEPSLLLSFICNGVHNVSVYNYSQRHCDCRQWRQHQQHYSSYVQNTMKNDKCNKTYYNQRAAKGQKSVPIKILPVTAGTDAKRHLMNKYHW